MYFKSIFNKKKLAFLNILLLILIAPLYADETPATALPTASDSNLSIYPTLSYVNADARNTISYYVINGGSYPVTVKASPAFVMQLGQKNSPFADDSVIPGSPNTSIDLSQNLLISPQVFTIMPGEARTVRVSLMPNHTLAPGGYAANMLFNTQAPPKLATVQASNTSGQNSGQDFQVNLTYLFNRIVTIYANKGIGYADKATVTCSIQANDYVFTITNNTPWFFDANFSANHKEDVLNSQRIQPLLPYSSGTRTVTFNLTKDELASATITWQLKNSPAIHDVSCKD